MIFSVVIFMLVFFPESKCITNRNDCCNKGSELANNFWKGHSKTLMNPSKICSLESVKNSLKSRNQTIFESVVCLVYARACCIAVSKTAVCQYGASQFQNCDFLSTKLPLVMNQILMECCLCCRENSPVSKKDLESCSLLNGRCPDAPIKKNTIEQLNVTEGSVSETDERFPNISSRAMKTNEPGKANESSTAKLERQTSSKSVTESILNMTTESPLTSNWNNITELPRTMSIGDSSTEWILRTTGSPSTSTNSPLSTAKWSSTTNNPNEAKQISNNNTMICETGQKWDSSLNVCLQMVISCPKNLILHPNKSQCVPIILPSIPCRSGLVYDQFRNVCSDINECENKEICKGKFETCVNIIGSFKCDCQKGFKINKNGLCEDIDECINLDLCPNDKKCRNTIGSYECVRAIPCGFGWKEDPDTNECIDVDECDSFPGICGPGMKCVNIRGSHKCDDDECPENMKRNNKGLCSRCKDGFRFVNETNQCEDVDECVTMVGWYKGHCKDTEVCFNLPGSYECIPKKKCRSGTVLSKNGMACEDIDECSQMKFRCEHDEICVNTFASFQCIASPCAPSQQYDYGSKKCVCREGYQSSGDNICTDIDECQENDFNKKCGTMYTCVNHPGSFSCIHRSECPSGMYRSSLYTSCQDIDECETGEGKCPKHMHCVNVVGSYKCMCNRGFVMLPNDTCLDVDECALFRPEETCPDLEAKCVNTAGSYKCQCPKGFQWMEYPIKKCLDIDECLYKKNPCGKRHECINTIGSFKCKCFQGFRLSISGDSCEDIDECLLKPKKCKNGLCLNVPGHYQCSCPQGFHIDKNEICQDIDECSSVEDVCSKEEEMYSSKMCINLFGYYKCVNRTCPREYERKETGNGFLCVLNKENQCKLKDVNCLQSKPYRISYQFVEILLQMKGQRVITRFNMDHLPPGVEKIRLQVKYAVNTDRKEPISVNNAFLIKKDRFIKDSIDIVMRKMIPPPAEILLYFHVSKHINEIYLGHSEAFIYLYLTHYPQLSNN